MEVTEKQKAKILNGVEMVLSQNKGLSDAFIQDKQEKIADVLMSNPEDDGGKAQEIKLDSDAFSAGLDDLSEIMSNRQL